MPSSITTGESIKLVCQDISILASSYVNPFQNISFLWALEMLLTFLQSENQGFPQCFDKMSLCLGQKFCSWVKQIQDFDGEYIWYLFYFPKEGRKKRILLNFILLTFEDLSLYRITLLILRQVWEAEPSRRQILDLVIMLRKHLPATFKYELCL